MLQYKTNAPTSHITPLSSQIAVTYFLGTITSIILVQKITRGYIVRVDPHAMRESLILRQLELEKVRTEKVKASKPSQTH